MPCCAWVVPFFVLYACPTSFTKETIVETLIIGSSLYHNNMINQSITFLSEVKNRLKLRYLFLSIMYDDDEVIFPLYEMIGEALQSQGKNANAEEFCRNSELDEEAGGVKKKRVVSI
ncbi:hypothetical protein ACJX0J_020005, partial [Zea mays]